MFLLEKYFVNFDKAWKQESEERASALSLQVEDFY